MIEFALEAAVWTVAALQALRIARRPVVWRIAKTYPLAAATVFVLGLVACGGIVMAMGSPPARRGITAVVLAALMLAAWRARPNRGARRKVPPGSLGFGASLDALDERRFYQREAERHGPIFKTSQFGQPVVCVMGTARGRDLLLKQRVHLEGARLPFADHVPQGVLRYMSDEDHREIGQVFRRGIAETDLARVEEEGRRAFREELGALVRESEEHGNVGVRAEAAIGRGVLRALSVAYLGLSSQDPELAVVEDRISCLDLGRLQARRLRADINAALTDVGAALSRAQRGGRIAPTSSLGRILVQRPDALDDAAISANLVLVLRMAYGDMTALLHWILKMLSDAPAWSDRMRAAPGVEAATKRPADEATRVVMEALRLEQSEFVYRRAAHDFEWGGYTIPKGWLIRVCVQESHRDPGVFDDPERFDPDRFLGRTFHRDEYSPFGADAHGCMGTAVVHFLGRLFVEELTRGFDWQKVSDGRLGRGIRHWQHWTPSPEFRIAITERSKDC